MINKVHLGCKIACEFVKRLDSIFENSYDGIYITDGDGNTLMINESYEKITGLSREDMLGRNMQSLVEEGYISESGSLRVMNSKRIETLSQTFNTGRTALITSSPIIDEQGDIILIVTNVRDLTELHQLKSALEKEQILVEKYSGEIRKLKRLINGERKVVVESKAMIDLFYSANKVAVTDFSVLLLGESGVGKEVLADFIHKHSMRKHRPFIKVNCAAIPESLIESELFGYEKGAFSGAKSSGKPGYFELADGGTIFLDEIGELSLNVQVKLLRVLQGGEIRRIGSVEEKKIDVRIISATNRDLEAMIELGDFRHDLFYRLDVISLTIPPLRERKEDIMAFSKIFLKQINKKYQWEKTIGQDVLEIFNNYDWPGNIRELKNVVERSVVMCCSDVIRADDLPLKIADSVDQRFFAKDKIISLKKAQIDLERTLIEKAYKKYGNVRDAAKALEIDASTLVRKRKRYQKM